MRLSSNLRRYRWAVFAAWLLLLVPSIYLAMQPVRQPHRRRLRSRGFAVAARPARARAALPRPGCVAAGPGRGPACRCVLRGHERRGRRSSNASPPRCPASRWCPTRSSRRPSPTGPYVITLQLDFNNTGAVDVAKQLRQKVGINGDQPGEIENGKVKLYVIGQGALGAAATAATKHDIAQAEQWNLPIVLIVLLAVFGSLAAAAMPLVLGICTVVVTMGLVYLLSMYTTMSVFVTSTVSMFGIALAIDYSLFILMRFREELRAGRDPEQAADAAMATSGLAVVLSGLTVIASVTGIYLINTPVLQSMATGAILAVAVAVLTSTTLTPAVLATFGRAAAKRSSCLHWSRRPETTQSRFWTRWTGWVMRRPWLSALARRRCCSRWPRPRSRWCWATACSASSTRPTRSAAASTRRPRRWARARSGRCGCW